MRIPEAELAVQRTLAASQDAGNGFSPGKKTMPFATGGYTLLFRQGAAHGFYSGGGVNRWMRDRWGIRIEGRNLAGLRVLEALPLC